jgi:assimilatory nitrate reductase catalytic subunit
MAETRSTCPYCGVGCGVIIESDGARITGVRGDPQHPANLGRLCTKGGTLHLTAAESITRQARLLQPMHRRSRDREPVPVAWNEALTLAADRFAGIVADHGPDAIGFYLSGQLLTEDYYVFNKLAKGLVGTNNVDTNSRLCMSSAVAGYKAALGADAPPACYDDVQHAQTIFIAGANTAWAHPILFRRIEDAKRANPSLKLIVADPRRTETAAMADLHLPLLPGSDIALFHGMLHVMLWEGWVDTAYIAAHTTGFEALKARVREFTPAETARLTGLQPEAIVEAARAFAGCGAGPERGPTLSLYCQGLNQSSSGAAKNAALINLHLACRQIGRPGAGPFSLTGQPNAMGGREVGGMANLLGGHRDLANAEHRAEIARLWGVPEVPAQPGKTAVELFEAAADGQIKALWVACTNPAQSMPDQAAVRRALQRAEFVVLQEAYAHTATARYADLLLPASSWGEKEGTVTNSERRISRVRAAIAPPGEARHDWRIAVDFAHRLEARLRPGRPTLFPYDTPEAIWNEHRESTRGRDLDITGLSYAQLERDGPQQWPCPEGAARGQTRLYEDARFATPDGTARFVDAPFRPLAEPRDNRYPFSLITGRLRDQWHGMSRTGTLGRLFGHVPEPVIELHAADLQRLGLADGDLAHVTTRRGSLLLPVAASETLAPTQAFVAMHWGEEVLSGVSATGERLAGVNALTTSAYCPASKQPELKHCAAKVLKAELPWSLLGAAWLPEAEAVTIRERLRALMPRFAYAACVPFGHDRPGVLLRAAAYEPAPDDLVDRIESLLQLQQGEAPALRYNDRRRGQRRTMRLQRTGPDTRLEGFLLAGDTSAEAWIKALLQTGAPAQAFGRQLLQPGAKPPSGLAPRGRQVCSCFDVGEAAIRATLVHCTGNDEQRLGALQQALRCGTNCGSCLPELKRLLHGHAPAAA